MTLVAERIHIKMILIRDYLNVENVNERVQGPLVLITIVITGVGVHSAYKPTNNGFVFLALNHIVHEYYTSSAPTLCVYVVYILFMVIVLYLYFLLLYCY